MPDIGQTLREARMRRRIDMTEVEAATKIRAKYLRALESEEWDLLPGSTFVKTFLRTYADYLGLDSRLLVEEYRQRYERPATQDLTPFSATRGRGGRRRRRLASVGPAITVIVGIALLLGALYWLGTSGDDDPDPPPNDVEQAAPPAREEGEGGSRDREREREPAPPPVVRLRLEALAPVYVCLVDARGRQVIDEQTLEPGTLTEQYRSRRFLTNFGNGSIRMRVNGRAVEVAESADPIGYELRPGRRPRRLSDEQRPDCSS